MQFKESLAKLRADKTFLHWEQENPNHYLAHGFIMYDKHVRPGWQIGLYNRETDRIVVFSVDEHITQNPPSELFKKDSGVKELVIADVHTDADAALAVAEAQRAEKYRGHEPEKTIILLQHLKQGQVWNISFITSTFTVCNFKLDTKTLDVLSSSCESLLGWGEAVPGNRKKE
jgi:hypothetical protein